MIFLFISIICSNLGVVRRTSEQITFIFVGNPHHLITPVFDIFQEIMSQLKYSAGGCGEFLVDYGHLLKDDPEWSKRATSFSNKIKDITIILVKLEFDKLPLQLDEQIVTYQDSCRLKNGQKTFMEPRQLLESIEGVILNKYIPKDSYKLNSRLKMK